MQKTHVPAGLPGGNQDPEFIQCIVEGNFEAGVKKIKETNALPAVCGRVCPQEEQCENSCILERRAEPSPSGASSGSCRLGSGQREE